MKSISVSCFKRDPSAFSVQKYDNTAGWNIAGGQAPNGVSATRYLRRTTPDCAQLTPLAAWLVEHLPNYVGGTSKPRTGNLRCEGVLTECDAIRRKHSHSPELADGIIKCYSVAEDRPTVIESWLFPQIRPHESDTQYWNHVAAQLVAAGTRSVSIDGRGPSMMVQ